MILHVVVRTNRFADLAQLVQSAALQPDDVPDNGRWDLRFLLQAAPASAAVCDPRTELSERASRALLGANSDMSVLVTSSKWQSEM